jgi:hypothetical protein
VQLTRVCLELAVHNRLAKSVVNVDLAELSAESAVEKLELSSRREVLA